MNTSVTWSPNLKQDIDKIERVQRRYTKKLYGLAAVSYNERLHRLQLCSLELRRLHFDLFMCYRIIFGLVNVCVCVTDFFELNCASLTRGHPYKLYKPRTYNTVRASYFSIRIVNVRNSLQLIELISLPLLLLKAQFNRLILLRFCYVLILNCFFILFFFLGYCQCLRPYNPVHTVYMNVMFYIFSFYLCYLCENKWWWWWWWWWFGPREICGLKE